LGRRCHAGKKKSERALEELWQFLILAITTGTEQPHCRKADVSEVMGINILGPIITLNNLERGQ